MSPSGQIDPNGRQKSQNFPSSSGVALEKSTKRLFLHRFYNRSRIDLTFLLYDEGRNGSNPRASQPGREQRRERSVGTVDLSNLIALLSGVALFLFGMTLMGDGLKKVAGNKLELVLYKLSSSPIKGVLLGTGVTAIIQSSSATSVMVVGFVNSGMMKVRQAIGIVLGAILGTSITGWIICLSDLQGGSGWVSLLSTSTLTGVVAVVGILLRMFSRSQGKQHVGDILLGFAVLMFGMQTMSASVSPLRESQAFLDLLTTFSNPLLGILVGMVFTFAYNYLAATLRAIGNTQAALFFLLISLGYNLGAAWVLVAQLGLGIQGTALATSSAQLLSALLCLVYIRKKQPFLMIQRSDMRMDPTLMRLTASYGAVAALQQSSLYLGKLIVQSAVNGISTAAISAFTATTRVENFSQAFGISGCEAIAIFVAQNQGAKKHRRALDGFRNGAVMVVGIGVVFSLLLTFGGHALVTPFLDGDGESIALGASYLLWMGPFYFLSFIGHSYVGHYRGIGRMNVTFIGTTLQIAVRVIGTYALVGLLGLNAVALATGLGWVVIVLFHSTVFVLELKGIGYRLPTRDEA